MLFPRSRVWSERQKRWIVAGVVTAAFCLCVGIFAYEHSYRGSSDRVLFGAWELPDDNGGLCYTFRPDHTVLVGGCDEPEPVIRGRWYAGGRNIYLSFLGEDAEFLHLRRPIIFHIVDIESDTLQITLWKDGPVHTYYRHRI